VLPFGPSRTSTVVHELGHALEAFAEAFTAWIGLPTYQPEGERLYRIDRAAFFDAIALQL
jgi:hypothetical protein